MGKASGCVNFSSGDEGHLFLASQYCRENPSWQCRLR
jgi:hypothetical protein